MFSLPSKQEIANDLQLYHIAVVKSSIPYLKIDVNKYYTACDLIELISSSFLTKIVHLDLNLLKFGFILHKKLIKNEYGWDFESSQEKMDIPYKFMDCDCTRGLKVKFNNVTVTGIVPTESNLVDFHATLYVVINAERIKLGSKMLQGTPTGYWINTDMMSMENLITWLDTDDTVEFATSRDYSELGIQQKSNLVKKFTDPIFDVLPSKYSRSSKRKLLNDIIERDKRQKKEESDESDEGDDNETIYSDATYDTDGEQIAIDLTIIDDENEFNEFRQDDDMSVDHLFSDNQNDLINTSANIDKILSRLSTIRTHYSSEQKSIVLSLLEHFINIKKVDTGVISNKNYRLSILEVLKELQYYKGYEKILSRDIHRWYINSKIEKKKKGPKLQIEFEKFAWTKLIFTIFKPENPEVQFIQENVTYSYDIILAALISARTEYIEIQNKLGEFDSTKLNKLLFSQKYITSFIKRNNFSRRKISTESKKQPELNAIIKRMCDNHSQFQRKERMDVKKSILNFDETGINYTVGPGHMFIPKDESRAHSISNNVMLRITAGVTVNANGDTLPLLIIIKHSATAATPDQSKMRVVRSIHKNDFKKEDNWEEKLWEKELVTYSKKLKVDCTNTHKCWYLINTVTGHVITSQHKAWNDHVRMCMYIELILKPYKDKYLKLVDRIDVPFLWLDNVGSHLTKSVQDCFVENEIDVALLPVNMTDILQVLDVVVNKVIKCTIRSANAKRVFNEFQVFLKQVESQSELPEQSRKRLKFTPSKPSIAQGIRELMEFCHNANNEEEKSIKFRKSISESFVKTGCAPDENNNFKVYDPICFTKGTSRISLNTALPIINQQINEGELQLNEGEFQLIDGADDDDDDDDNNDATDFVVSDD